MSLVSDAQSKLGELFIIGFEGQRLSDDTAAFLSQAAIGGVIYFSHNYKNPQQLAELSNQVQECRADRPLWIAADQEGGPVQRFKDPFTQIPPANLVGRCKSPKLAFEVAEVIAKELSAVGVNLNFCPVGDIFSNPSNPVITEDRSYGKDVDQVSRTVTSIVRGHVVSKVQPCIKHFPGHGDTYSDSHHELPRVNRSLKDLNEREFRPFVRAFKSRCNMVMTAHILNEALDPKYPATLSPYTIREVLRKELRFSRLIISDDMEMKAISDHYGADEAPLLAVQAGCNVLIYRSEAAGRHAYEVLFSALEDGKISPEVVIESAEQARSIKKETLKTYLPLNPADAKNIVGNAIHKAVMERVLAETK